MKDDFYGEVAKHASQPGEGATVDVRTGQEASSGWAVAQAGHEHVEPRQSFSEDSLKRYAGQNRQPLEQAGYMGLWHPSRVQAGRPKGIYHDVVSVKPDTYKGGASAIAEGYENNQDAIFNMDRFQELHMRPESRRQKQGTRKAMNDLRAQRPASMGSERKSLEDVPTAELGAAFRNRRPV